MRNTIRFDLLQLTTRRVHTCQVPRGLRILYRPLFEHLLTFGGDFLCCFARASLERRFFLGRLLVGGFNFLADHQFSFGSLKSFMRLLIRIFCGAIASRPIASLLLTAAVFLPPLGAEIPLGVQFHVGASLKGLEFYGRSGFGR